MRNGLNQCHLQNNIFKVFEDTCTWVQYLQNVCCANKVCPCFLILLLQLPAPDYSCPAGEQLATPVSCAVLSATQTPDQQDLCWSSYLMLQLLESFPTFPLLPLTDLCKPSPLCLLYQQVWHILTIPCSWRVSELCLLQLDAIQLSQQL